MDYSYLERNLAGVREGMSSAMREAGREDEVILLAAIKSADVEEIRYLHDVLGVRYVGENRVQQLLERYEQIRREDMEIHFIGTLQTNKVKYIVDKVSMIHSVDSIKLAAQIDRLCAAKGIVMDILVEINSGEEENKSGLLPADVLPFCEELKQFSHIRHRGFMTMAPKCEKKEEYRKFFAQTYQLCIDIWTKKLHNIGVPVISMGMSESYEEAILEGSNLVRVGRTLFVK